MHRLMPLLLVAVFALAACGGEDPTLEAPEGDGTDTTDTTDEADEPGDTAEDAPEDAGDYDVSDQPADAQAMFAAPADGDTVTMPVRVDMRAAGVEIAPAGDPVVGQGHFHVVVDAGCVPDGEVVPGPGDEAVADGYYHFGDGSSAGQLELVPGTYELCVQLADGLHQAFGGTETITVTVE